jgi:hypothetical protein
MEPQTNYYAHPHETNMGKPFLESFKYNACPTIYVLFGKSTDDVATYEKSICWSGPWFLPKFKPVAKLFLATWCQSNSRPLFPRLSPTTQITLLGDFALARFDKVVELPYLSRSALASYVDEVAFGHSKV